MNPLSFHVYISGAEEERFGVKTARAESVTMETLPAVMEFCRENDVVFLVARSSTSEIKVAQTMERKGFLLMDTLMHYTFFYDKTAVPEDTGKVCIRSARPGDENAVKVIAETAFHNYYGHYHADDRLDNDKCDEAYKSWASRACTREIADDVLVAESDGQILGFCSAKLDSADEAVWTLGSISPAAQGKGIFRSLTIGVLEWGRAQGVKRLITSALINTLPVLRTWEQTGFILTASFYTFHKWFDEK